MRSRTTSITDGVDTVIYQWRVKKDKLSIDKYLMVRPSWIFIWPSCMNLSWKFSDELCPFQFHLKDLTFKGENWWPKRLTEHALPKNISTIDKSEILISQTQENFSIFIILSMDKCMISSSLLSCRTSSQFDLTTTISSMTSWNKSRPFYSSKTASLTLALTWMARSITSLDIETLSSTLTLKISCSSTQERSLEIITSHSKRRLDSSTRQDHNAKDLELDARTGKPS